MTAVGKHSGATVSGPSLRRLWGQVAGMLATVVAWVVLVYYAIQLGPDAKAGELGAWVLLVIATLGAIGCLFLALILGGRLYELLRGEPHPATLSGGRRARR
jgi:hypothetical protein